MIRHRDGRQVVLPSFGDLKPSDRLDLEVQCNETEDQRLQILDEVVKHSEAFWIRGFGHVVDRTNFGSLRRVSMRLECQKAWSVVPQKRCGRCRT